MREVRVLPPMSVSVSGENKIKGPLETLLQLFKPAVVGLPIISFGGVIKKGSKGKPLYGVLETVI